MKRLTLFRHAKSSWEFDVPDRSRPLKKRGINDTKIISEHLKDESFDLIASSPAQRTLETSSIFFDALKLSFSKRSIVEELYDFGGIQVIDYIKSLEDKYENVLIFGHNHAFTSIANFYGNIAIDNLPTSGVVTIEFDILSWKDLKPGITIKTLFPRDFK